MSDIVIICSRYHFSARILVVFKFFFKFLDVFYLPCSLGDRFCRGRGQHHGKCLEGMKLVAWRKYLTFFVNAMTAFAIKVTSHVFPSIIFFFFLGEAIES